MRNLRFTLRYENKEYVLDEQIPIIDNDSTQKEIEAHQKHYDDANKVSCIMATSMSPELQKTFENTWAYEMNQQLKEMFQAKASKERLDVVKSLMACKPKPRASICAFALEMKGYFDRLESLNMVFDAELSINIIVSGDPKEAVCFYCNTKGHWKRSCPKYLKGSQRRKGRKGWALRSMRHEMTKSPFTRTCERGEGLLDLVHTDVCGPFRSTTKDGKRYYITFTDDFSRYGFVYLIKHKSGTFEMFKRYQNKVENQLGRKIKVLQSDRGGEYISIKFFDHLKNCGIVSQLSPHRTPQLNGVAERRNRTLLDMVRSMMYRATLPISLWGYALETAVHILNLVPTKKVFVRREAQDKLEARYEKCLFVGYPEESFGYLLYRPKDNVVFVARRGTFLEREMISKEDSGSKIDLEEILESADEEPIVNIDTQQEVVTPVEPNDISLPIRKTSSRVSKPSQDPQFYYGFHIEEDKISDSTLIDLNEPANYKEAMACPEAAKWKEAMKSEIQSMYDNQVWNLVDTTPGLKIVGCKWIFKKKTCMDGNVHTYKARLVAKGYTQTHRIDYEETFSLVAKIKSIRIMLAIAAFYDYEIWQIDVKTAFLNGKLTEDVFMAQPKGNDIPTLQSVKEWLGKCFAMKDLGDATYVLGIKIYRDRTRHLIGLSQDTYLDKILKRFNMENSKKGILPLHHGIKISSDLCPKNDDELDKISRVLYASAIGSIMYAMTCTRPDVSFALSMVSRHQQNPGEEKELRVTSYCDTSWQTDKDDSKSQSGWVFLLNGGAETWKSSKQDTVADSTCESEYIAACEASKEAIWMKNFIGDLGVVPTVQDPIEIFYDNESPVALTKEPKDHGKSKHIDRKYHFVRSKVAEGHAIVKDVRSDDNPVDPFTKALANSKHDEHAWSIGLKDKIKF
ncbi:retrotransposon protein, putative, ty1-copia subclass [Tanacetum coccineum]